MRITIPQIKAKKGAEPIVMLTAYTAPFAKILDKHVDVLLVGDSVGMVIYGMESTLPVSIDMMINHGRAVVNASKKALVVVDMPFGSYQKSKENAFENAAKIMKETGCSAVKLEGGEEMVETVEFLTQRAIPVVGHIGLMPQHVHTLGGYKYQGKTKKEQDDLIRVAKLLEQAGAFAVVVEAVSKEAARRISSKTGIPIIGIGASASCDGQVLVTEDMIGMFGVTPRFVKKYGAVAVEIERCVAEYTKDVRGRKFPEDKHCFLGKK